MKYQEITHQMVRNGTGIRRYRHDILKHSSVFYACAVITQLTVANEEPLFEVEYGDSIISS